MLFKDLMKLCIASFVIESILLVVKMGKRYMRYVCTLPLRKHKNKQFKWYWPCHISLDVQFLPKCKHRQANSSFGKKVETLVNEEIWQWSPCAWALFPGKRDIWCPLHLFITWGNITSVIYIWERISNRYQINQQLGLEPLLTDK